MSIRFAEVKYFFNLPVHGNTHPKEVALIKLFSEPDPHWLKKSHSTYRVCKAGTDADLVVVPVNKIKTVVAMIPNPRRGQGCFSAVRKPGCRAFRTGVDRERIDENTDDPVEVV